MLLKGIIEEDFINYKKPSLLLMFPFCDFKCDIENKQQLCQNSDMATASNIYCTIEDIIKKYFKNPITQAIVCSGLEPFDSEEDLYNFIKIFRFACNDDIVIYTGYTEEEIINKFYWIYKFKNIIIKFGRFKPNHEIHYDEILGVNLISNNQYSKKIK